MSQNASNSVEASLTDSWMLQHVLWWLDFFCTFEIVFNFFYVTFNFIACKPIRKTLHVIYESILVGIQCFMKLTGCNAWSYIPFTFDIVELHLEIARSCLVWFCCTFRDTKNLLGNVHNSVLFFQKIIGISKMKNTNSVN